MTETKHVPGATYGDMSQMVSPGPKQALHQTKIVIKTTTKNIKNYPHQITKFFKKLKIKLNKSTVNKIIKYVDEFKYSIKIIINLILVAQ